MFTHNQPWTDKFGLTHQAAVIVISHAQYTCNAGQSKNFVRSKHPETGVVTEQYVDSDHDHRNIHYQVQYWPSQQAKDDDSQPLEYRTDDGMREIVFSVTAEPVDLIAECESHFAANVLGAGA